MALLDPRPRLQPDAPEGAPPTRADFDALYRAHAPFVWRSLRRLGVREAALDDATQEVFLVVHRRFADFRPGPTERAWLFAIAQRVASDHRRWLRRKGNLMPIPEQTMAQGQSPYEGALRREASDWLLAFLDQLDDARRDAFILSELEQMTFAEASTALGVNANTIASRVASGRRALLTFLDSRGLAPRASEEGTP
ncbi:MAG TPA: sigma-70 family RNA polymerase sigma factor [Polyangiales bacterium]|nr:sigma-70 family RNA polymerase sigma factor [Polyangiales bacterium]